MTEWKYWSHLEKLVSLCRSKAKVKTDPSHYMYLVYPLLGLTPHCEENERQKWR